MQISQAGCGHVSLWSERSMARARHAVLIRSIDPLRDDARCGVGSQAPRFQLTSQPDPVLSGDRNIRRLILSRTAAAPPRSKTN